MLITASDFVVSPGPALFAVLALMVCIPVAGGVTAAKGRWGWCLIGLLTGGLVWLVTAFLEPSPGSYWSRRSTGASTGSA